MKHQRIQFAGLAFAIAAATGCANDSAGPGGAGLDTRQITTSGQITGFGSIFVNGIEFETGSASISLDDNPGVESDLRLGMVVTVSGRLDDSGRKATAARVIFDDEVQGPVSNIVTAQDGTSKTLTVLGVIVKVDKASTVFDNIGFDTIALDDVIEVSGFVDADGALLATRIEKKSSFIPGTSEIELKGLISNLGVTTFSLGKFSVEYRNADLSRLPGGTPREGMQVEVKGTLTGNTIKASRIKQEDDLIGGSAGGKVSLEGIVTDFVGNSDFRVSGQTVDASGATFNPATLKLGNGIEVEVEGPIVNGVLQAIKVDIRGGNVKLEASLAAASKSGNTVTLQFVPGTIEVQLDGGTRMRDDLDIASPLTIDHLSAGDFLEIRGYLDGANNIVARELRRDKQDDDILQGPANKCIEGSNIEVLGLSFTMVDGATQYRDIGGNALPNSAAFCNLAGDSAVLVKIKDKEKRRDGIADEVQIEN